MGLTVLQATNGLQVLDLLKDHQPHMIFMDVNMPKMDGFTATSQIRLLPSPACKTPIIALTADAMKEDRDRCIEAGMNDYISKPFRLEELEDVLKKTPRKNIVSRIDFAGSRRFPMPLANSIITDNY